MFRRAATSFLFFFMILAYGSGQDAGAIPANVISAFRNGDAKALSEFFNTKIELVILDRENVYSKTQAELIMKSFFEKNKPSGFRVIHKGGRSDAQYAIGLYSSSGKMFRVYMLIKTVDKTPRIHQLRIEKENGQS